MNFLKAVDIVLEQEGGYSLDPNDPGGQTNFGISKRSYPILNIQALTREGAIDIYKKDFWDRYCVDQLPDQIKLIFFDSCVNQGPGFAVKALQKCVGQIQDGAIGIGTLNAVKLKDPETLLHDFTMERFEAYKTNKRFDAFGIGWLERLIEVVLVGMSDS